jgi:glycosyltransferase involved in cell wall biosynthesis
MQNPEQIVMIGTKQDANGGIASVISAYEKNGLFERRDIIYLATHSTGTRAGKIILFLTSYKRFIHLLISRKVSLAHVHVACDVSFWRKCIFVLAAKTFRAPVLLHIHAGHFPEFYFDRCTKLQKWIVRRVLNSVDHIAVVSRPLDGFIRSIAKPKSIVTIKNPATLSIGTKPRQRHPTTILFLGHLSAEKGVYDLIHAMRDVAAIFPDARLLLCGDGDLEAINKTIKSLGLSDVIEVLGWVDQEKRGELLVTSTIFVLPSHAEGLPMSILEAMVAELPVIATDVGGIPEAIDHERDGLLIPPGDVASLTTSILRLLQDPAERYRLSESAFVKVKDLFSASRAIASLEQLYDDISVYRYRFSDAKKHAEKETVS